MIFYIKLITILFMFYFGLNGIFGFIYILLNAETRSDVDRGVLFIFLGFVVQFIGYFIWKNI
ncbi:hypothetical protein JDFnp2_37 [Fusobacterium phage JD-Fnp2]|nr:hypothetical protein JDFnp2_37 [Fusobacterium phage JD-Fnp2]UTV61063.1 hypothetical protein JDFnp3_25 [Fusobacterium phage JD-Fnp3]UTV61145.1 hypothetical protein JDFnp5_39 [Fusobacterium phage JD-Fnp5]